MTQALRLTRSYRGCVKLLLDAPGLSGGDSRSPLKTPDSQFLRMPPPCAVEAHVPCYLLHASSKREPPRGEPVASKPASSALLVATNVRLPRTSRGHPAAVFSAPAEHAGPFANKKGGHPHGGTPLQRRHVRQTAEHLGRDITLRGDPLWPLTRPFTVLIETTTCTSGLPLYFRS